MKVLSYEQIKDKLTGKNRGIYLIYGEETYFINSLLKEIKEKYNDKISTFFGGECTIAEIFNNAYQESLFNDFNVIIVKNLEENKFIIDKKNETFIKNYVTNFKANAMLILIYNKTITKTCNILNLFEDTITYNSKKLEKYQIKNFIKDYCKEHNIEINEEKVDKLYNYYDNNIELIKNELDRNNLENLSYVKEFNAFEFMNYIAMKKIDKLILVVNNFGKKNKNDIIPLIGLIFNFFTKLLAFKTSKNKNDYPSSYQYSADLYSEKEILEIINTINYCDKCLKGIKSEIFDHKDILKFLISSIIIK